MEQTETTKRAPSVKYTNDFALLDVKSGRASLARLFASNGYPADAKSIRIPVTINGYITHRHGDDDGVSIEYGVEVETLKVAGGN
jgi:hypothetical protein